MLASERYYLGADVGGTKTQVLIADEAGQAVCFGEGGPGNYEMVGYAGLSEALHTAVNQAMASGGVSIDQIAGAGFGVAGYDWPSDWAPTMEVIRSLRLDAPLELVNDTIIGLLAGSPEGWGIAVVSGTGCNCWGWDRTRQHEGRVTGGGVHFGEGAGGSELVAKAVQALAHEFTRRGPATALTPAFIQHSGTASLPDLLAGLMRGRYQLTAGAAPLVFQVAAKGDPVARGLIEWAGRELGEMANAVIRQLAFEVLDFDVVLLGSMFDGSPLLNEHMRRTIHGLAPGARLTRLAAPPVIGAVLLGMEQAGIQPTTAIRQNLVNSVR